MPDLGFRLSLDVPAPSINHLYSRTAFRVFLSKKGRKFKALLTSAVVRATQTLPWQEAVDEVYKRRGTVKLTVIIYTPRFWNKSWKPGAVLTAKTSGKKSLQSPYQKIDVSNFSKIIEDGVADGTGIDDRHHHDVRYKLREGDKPRISIIYRVLPYEAK